MKKKSIYACYEEIKQREINELKDAVRSHGGKYVFDTSDFAPEVLCNLKYGGPSDVRITSVSLEGEQLTVKGQQHGESGCAEWYNDETEVNISDIAYGHIDFITSSIPKAGSMLTDKEKENLLLETAIFMASELFNKLYDPENGMGMFETCHQIRDLARKFEESLNWQVGDDEDVYFDKLDEYVWKCLTDD